MFKNKLYIFILLACFIGYLYIFFTIFFFKNATWSVCLIKSFTCYPCPSCGTTRAILLLFQGKLLQSVLINPFGVFVFFIMTFAPIWILFDYIKQQQSFYNFYQKLELKFNNKWFSLFFVVLVLLNWIWNINKAL